MALALGCLLVVLGLAATCVLRRRQVSVPLAVTVPAGRLPREQGGEKRGSLSPPSGSLGAPRTEVGEEPRTGAARSPKDSGHRMLRGWAGSWSDV